MKVKRLVSGLLALIFLIVALGAGYTAYRRLGTPVHMLQGAVMVEGVITEKLIQSQPDNLLPFPVRAYVVRYAFPNPQGQMRTGEQIVTQGFFERLGEQGALASIYLLADDSSINAVDARITFPGAAGWRLGIGIVCLVAAYFMFLFGVLRR